MVSVIATGGQQYVVTVGKKLQIDKIKTSPGGVVEFEDVLNKGQIVKAKVIGDSKSKKKNILKFKNKSRYLRQKSHRQVYTVIEVTEITAKKSTAKSPKKKVENGKQAKSS